MYDVMMARPNVCVRVSWSMIFALLCFKYNVDEHITSHLVGATEFGRASTALVLFVSAS